MTMLLTMPALAKVGLAFIIILLLHRFKLPLSACLLLGATTLGLLMGQGPGQAAGTIIKSALSSRTLSLVVIVTVILTLSSLMSDYGQLDRIVASFSRLVRNTRLVSLTMPALIGLLPMPGGALFSAPMVESACRESGLNNEHKTAINYWFRHIWEFWWPLYPGVVLAVSLLNVSPWRFMAFQFPLSLLTVAAGAVFLLPTMSGGPSGRASAIADSPGWPGFLREIRPIILVILVFLLVKVFETVSGLALPPMTTVFLGLALCLAAVVRDNGAGLRQVFAAAVNRNIVPMLLLVVSVMAFQGVLIQSRAVDEIQQEIARYGIPPLLIIMFIPFLTGLITGLAAGFVGASFPLIVPLLADMSGFDFMIHAGLAYTCGHLGQMMSPVHLCFLVTKDFFSARLLLSYRYIIGPSLLLLALVLIMYGLTRFLL